MTEQAAPTTPDTDAIETAVGELVTQVPEIIKESKAGWKTTEFWLTIVGLLALNLNGVVLTLPDKYQAIGSAILAVGYALSRGQAKKGIPDITVAAPPA